MSNRLPETLLQRILDPFFVERFREAVRTRLVPLAKRDPRLLEFVAEHTGLARSLLEAHWEQVYRLLLAVYRGRVRARRAGAAARLVTPATALLWAAYEEHGADAVERLYEALEPIILGDPARARLLFLPVEPSTLGEAVCLTVGVARALGLGERGLRALADTLCAVSSTLDAKAAAECARMVRGAWSTRTCG